MKLIETPIEDLKIKLNKVIGDKRGYLYEVAPNGIKNELIYGKIGNVYMATAKQKHIARGGHYHHQLTENFYTISGQALWLFKDFRKDSKTLNSTYAVLLGEKDESVDISGIDSYLLPDSLAQVFVPEGVYHIFFPLTDKKVEVLAITNLPHDNDDYVRFDPKEDKDLNILMKKYLKKI